MGVLISTAWWPSKTKCFARYSAGVSRLLSESKFATELFITTRFHESKFGSNFDAIKQAAQWAVENRFNHMLILDADIVLGSDGLDLLMAADVDVILAGRGHGSGVSRMDLGNPNTGRIGWGCSLIKTDVLKRCPIEYAGDYATPDRMWFKKLINNGIPVWCHFDVVPCLLEKSETFPMAAFNPKGE